jgi:phosphohistidine phosphatase
VFRLYLFRHAKSSWNARQVDDFERPLNSRGRSAAPAMARHIASSGIAPDLILCSAAQRARETLALALPSFVHDCTIHIERCLYLTDAPSLLERIRSLPDGARQCMIIGHNPGLQQLALLLAADGETDDMTGLRAKFPTAAVAGIELAQSHWREIGPGDGRLFCFLTPRALNVVS